MFCGKKTGRKGKEGISLRNRGREKEKGRGRGGKSETLLPCSKMTSVRSLGERRKRREERGKEKGNGWG